MRRPFENDDTVQASNRTIKFLSSLFDTSQIFNHASPVTHIYIKLNVESSSIPRAVDLGAFGLGAPRTIQLLLLRTWQT